MTPQAATADPDGTAAVGRARRRRSFHHLHGQGARNPRRSSRSSLVLSGDRMSTWSWTVRAACVSSTSFPNPQRRAPKLAPQGQLRCHWLFLRQRRLPPRVLALASATAVLIASPTCARRDRANRPRHRFPGSHRSDDRASYTIAGSLGAGAHPNRPERPCCSGCRFAA